MYSINLGGGGGLTLNLRSSSEAIVSGQSSVTVTFSSPMPNTDYALVTSITNTADADPIFLQVVSTTKTVNGFVATFNAVADSGNYELEYFVCEDQ